MAKERKPDSAEELKATIGRRLGSARRGAGFSEIDAANAIGHDGGTQVSLAENGKRFPTVYALRQLADLYGVSVDYLLGRIDDPIAEQDELAQGSIVRSLSKAMSEHYRDFVNSLSNHAAICIAGHRQDRLDIHDMICRASDMVKAYDRMKALNPEIEEDFKGSASVEASIRRVVELGEQIAKRLDYENRQRVVVDKILKLDQMEAKIKQFALEFR